MELVGRLESLTLKQQEQKRSDELMFAELEERMLMKQFEKVTLQIFVICIVF